MTSSGLDDGGSFEACGDNSLTLRDVENVCEDISEFHCTVSQYTPRNVVRTRSFSCIDPAEVSPHTVQGQRHYLVAGRRWSLLCSGAVFCLKARKEGIQLVQQGDGAVTGLWWGLVVVRNGLNPLPQAPCVSAVAETMCYPPGVLSLGLSDAAG